jgi:hypothetical protein
MKRHTLPPEALPLTGASDSDDDCEDSDSCNSDSVALDSDGGGPEPQMSQAAQGEYQSVQRTKATVTVPGVRRPLPMLCPSEDLLIIDGLYGSMEGGQSGSRQQLAAAV